MVLTDVLLNNKHKLAKPCFSSLKKGIAPATSGLLVHSAKWEEFRSGDETEKFFTARTVSRMK